MALSQDGLHDMTADVRQTEVTALEAIGESFVIDSEQVQHGRMQIVNMDHIGNGVITKLVGGTISSTPGLMPPPASHKRSL